MCKLKCPMEMLRASLKELECGKSFVVLTYGLNLFEGEAQ